MSTSREGFNERWDDAGEPDEWVGETQLTETRLAALEKLADGSELTQDDHTNLSGAARDLSAEAAQVSESLAHYDDDQWENLSEASATLDALAQRHQDGLADADDRQKWGEALQALEEYRPGYAEPRIADTAQRLAEPQ